MPPRSLRLTESASEEVEEQHGDVGEIASAMATLFISLPALGFMGITATAGAKAFSHSLSFGVMLAALTNLSQYAAWKGLSRKGSHWNRFGPAYLILISVPLVLADEVRHLLQDADLWPEPGSSMYRDDCPYSVKGITGILCLTLVGWLFTIIFTYIGFGCMLTDLHIKVPKAYKDIRRARSAASLRNGSNGV